MHGPHAASPSLLPLANILKQQQLFLEMFSITFSKELPAINSILHL